MPLDGDTVVVIRRCNYCHWLTCGGLDLDRAKRGRHCTDLVRVHIFFRFVNSVSKNQLCFPYVNNLADAMRNRTSLQIVKLEGFVQSSYHIYLS